MRIFHKIIVSGSITEIYSYEQGIAVGKKKKKQESRNNERIPKKERYQRDEINLNRSLTRTRQTLRRTINANIDKWGRERPKFMTLTFKDNIQDHDVANKEFRAFIKRLSRKILGKQSGLKYTCVVERQARGAIHYHILFYNLPFIKHKELVNIWSKGKDEKQGVRINEIKHFSNVGAYIVKYIEKDICAVKNGRATKTGKSAKEKNKKLFSSQEV